MAIKTAKDSTISLLDKFGSRTFQFHIQRWMIFIVVFVISFISLWNFNFFDGAILSKIKNDWPSLAWRFFFLFALYSTARPIAKFIAESYNRNLTAWIATLLFVAFAANLYIFTQDIKVSSLSTIKLEYFAWVLPGILLPAVGKLLGIVLTNKVAPLQSQRNFIGLLTTIFAAGMTICGFLIGFYDLVEGEKFSFDSHRYQLLVSFEIISFVFMAFTYIYSILKFKKIKFQNQNISIPLLVILPIFVSVLIWMFKGTFRANLNMSPELWFLIAVSVLISLMLLFTIFFAKEVKVAKIMNTIYSGGLLLIWIGVFTYVKYYGLINDSYVVVDIAAVASVAIFFMMAIYDRTTKMGIVQETIFSAMIVIMLVLIIFFTIVGKAKLFDELLLFAPVDLKSLLPVLLIALPGLYFVISVSKILWAQSRITHGIRIEKIIRKKRAKEALFKKEVRHD